MPASWVLAGSDPQQAVLVARFIVEEETVAEELLYFVKPKDLALPRPNVRVSIQPRDQGYRISLESDVLAKNVYLRVEGDGGHFSDNYFDLLPGRVKVVDLLVSDRTVHVREGLRVCTLADTY